LAKLTPYLAAAAAIAARHSIKKKSPAPPKGRASHSGRSGARAAIGFDGVASQRGRRRAPPAARGWRQKPKNGIGGVAARLARA